MILEVFLTPHFFPVYFCRQMNEIQILLLVQYPSFQAVCLTLAN